MDIISGEFIKKGSLVHSVTNLDVSLVDVEGTYISRLIQNKIPIILQSFNIDVQLINETLRKCDENYYYHYINHIGLEYLATGIRNNSDYLGFVIIGPFLSSIPSNAFISDLISKHRLPVSERKEIYEFFQSLTLKGSSESTYLGELLVNLYNHSYINSQLIRTEFRKHTVDQQLNSSHDVEEKHVIEDRYRVEKELMRAIAKGDKEKVALLSKETKTMLNFSDRIPESPFRSAKNILFVLNTICRIAAEQGGLEPVNLHHVSEKFAILIERSPNLPYLKKLGFDMIREYCDLVHKHSIKNYSTLVKKAIHYIHLNLEKPLTLNEIAAAIPINPSHLSRKFKQETTLGVIDYVNQKRIEEAQLLLKARKSSITDIALIVGYNDLNYFSRVFKKFTGQTPSQFIKNQK
nr:helix-turn-helix domain-containing protein [Neobacillus sp. Marseille-Q6967]